MPEKIDELARALREAPADRDLTAVEARVWRRLDDEAGWAFFGAALSPQASLAAARMSLGAIVLMAALIVGAAAATWGGSEPNELAVFSTDAPFAPTSLLAR
jgi:monoamine oxidase